jgi:hypothetical protein
MQKLLHILISILVVVSSIIKFNIKEISITKVLLLLLQVVIILLIANLFIWLIHFLAEKVFNWFEKRKQRNYSLMDWLGDATISLGLYSDLSEIKTFNREKFYENYQTVKDNIKGRYTTINELRSFKYYLELRTDSQKYNAILNSTQTILIAIIIPIVITLTNIKTFNSTASSISAILFLVFWLILLAAIDFITKQIDKTKELLRLVKECIEDHE